MLNLNKKLCIVGVGGFARETLLIAISIYQELALDYTQKVVFLVKDEDWSDEHIMGVPLLKESDFSEKEYTAVVAVGDPAVRKKIVHQLPKTTEFATLIDPKANVSSFNAIAEGCIITSGVVVTCNVTLGKHVHLNLNTTVGHDSIIEDFVTVSPGVNISGDCKVGPSVYIGTGAQLRNGISVVGESTIGMGSVVVKSISESGVYVGNPAKKR